MAIGMTLFAPSRQRLARYFELGKSFSEQRTSKGWAWQHDVDLENACVEIYVCMYDIRSEVFNRFKFSYLRNGTKIDQLAHLFTSTRERKHVRILHVKKKNMQETDIGV